MTILNILSLKIKPISIPTIELNRINGIIYITISSISKKNKLLLFRINVIKSEKNNWIRPIKKDHMPMARR